MLANNVSPPLRRALLDIENAAHRRLEVAGHVGVPALPVRARTVLVGVDFHQRGLARLVRRGRMDVQLAEQPAESQMLLRRDVLVAEEDDDVLGQRPVDLVHRPVGQRLGEIDAIDLRADDRGQLVDADRFIRLRCAGIMPNARAVLAAQRAHWEPPGKIPFTRDGSAGGRERNAQR